MKKTIKNIIKKSLVRFGLYSFITKQIEAYYCYQENKFQNKVINKNYNLIKSEFDEFNVLERSSQKRFDLSKKYIYPIKFDKTENIEFDPHYTYHTAWAARVLKEINPKLHVDISSILYFNTIVSAFIPIKFYDYRPANIKLTNLKSDFADLTNLKFDDNSILSLSCMHVVEHIGLGRYGDKLDYDGDLKAINELKRVLAIGGDLIFVVPIGEAIIQFNAHRIYSFNQIVNYFESFKLIEYALIPDNANEVGIIYNASVDISDKQEYGCGCFWFKK